MQFTHLRRNEADGHSNAIQLYNTKDGSPIMIEAPSEDSLDKWMKAFKRVKERLLGIQQQ